MIYENIEKAKRAKDEAKRIDELKAKLYVEADSIDEFKLQCTMNGVNLGKLDPFLIHYYIMNNYQFVINSAFQFFLSLSAIFSFVISVAITSAYLTGNVGCLTYVILYSIIATLIALTAVFDMFIITPRYETTTLLIYKYKCNHDQLSSTCQLQQGYTAATFTSISSLSC